MTFRESLDWLYSTQRFGIKLGLENMRRLRTALAHPAGREPLIFHVAGTNGKGSICAMIDALLRAGGKRSGLYTSPHLATFRERICIDGTMISEDAAADGLSRIRDLVRAWDPSPTYFELTTALALWWFEKNGVDAMVLETGLGGRLDATNIVTPAAAVISHIGLDHQQHLGSTIEEIAREKAGIIKSGCPVVLLPQDPAAAAVIESTAAERNAPLFRAGQPWTESRVALAGSHQKWNATAAVMAVRITAGDTLDAHASETEKRALSSVEWRGRFQRAGDRIILDGGHNPAAAERLAETWREEFGDRKATLVLGVMGDKDIPGVVSPLLAIAARVFTVTVQNERAATADELAEAVNAFGSELECRAFSRAADAIAAARLHQENVLVAGSLFLVGEALIALGLATGDEPPSLQ